MLRRILVGMALTGAALIPAMSAADAAPAKMGSPWISAWTCAAGGGVIRASFYSPTGWICYGGWYNGFPVLY